MYIVLPVVGILKINASLKNALQTSYGNRYQRIRNLLIIIVSSNPKLYANTTTPRIYFNKTFSRDFATVCNKIIYG